MLASCYRRTLDLAVQKGARTIAFPSISTGIYRFPVERAARIAVDEIRHFLEKDGSLEEVRLICFDRGTFDAYVRALSPAP